MSVAKPVRRPFKQAVAMVLLSSMIATSGCGFLLYPERKGQQNEGIDPVIAVLDAAGLLIHPVLGIVAFAVDITNGTLFLAPGEKSAIDRWLSEASPAGTDQPAWTALDFIDEPSAEAIAERISRHTGEQVTAEMIQWSAAGANLPALN